MPHAGDDRADDRQHDCAADLERGVDQAGGKPLLVVGHARRRLHVQRRERRARTRCPAAGSSAGSSSRTSASGRRAGTARSRRRTTRTRRAISRCGAEAVDQRRRRAASRRRRAGRPGRNASAVCSADQPSSPAGTASPRTGSEVAAEHRHRADVRPHQRARAQDARAARAAGATGARSPRTRASSAAATANDAIVSTERPADVAGPARRVRTSSSMPAVIVTRAGDVERAAGPAAGAVGAQDARRQRPGSPARTARAAGTSSASRPRSCRPPRTRPNEKPLAPQAV